MNQFIYGELDQQQPSINDGNDLTLRSNELLQSVELLR